MAKSKTAGVDPLNPLSPRNPSQQIHQDSSKPNIQAIEKEDATDYVEGYEQVFLPSRGVFYTGPAKGMEYIKIRRFDYSDEDILSTPSFYENGTIYTEILDNVILKNQPLTAKNLVPIDRDTLLIWLRSTAFGNDFRVEYKCPNCKKGSGNNDGKGLEMVWNLQDLEIPTYEDEVYQELLENGEKRVITPILNLGVRIIVPSTSLVKTLEKNFTLKKEKEKIKNDFFATTTLLSVVSGIELEDGKVLRDKGQIHQYFKKVHLPISDSRFILSEAKKINLSYDSDQIFICKDCKHVEEGVGLPIMHRNFFWPES